MAYVLTPQEDALAGVARVIDEQVLRVREASEHAAADPAEFVRKGRVRGKRIRAVLRMARPAMAGRDYRRLNEWWRDTSRIVSGARDRAARVEALEAVGAAVGGTVPEAAVEAVRNAFLAEAGRDGSRGALRRFVKRIRSTPETPAFKSAEEPVAFLIAGAAKTYGAARQAMRAALEAEEIEAFHDWRKQAKYHGLQMRLLRRLRPAAAQRVEATRHLALYLGAVQDIAVVIEGIDVLAPDGVLDGASHDDLALLGEVLTARQEVLIERALEAGEQLFDLRRSEFRERLSGKRRDEVAGA
ncbi:MAG: CHAD domain-containing protein [Hyphomonadaceae bacterium]